MSSYAWSSTWMFDWGGVWRIQDGPEFCLLTDKCGPELGITRVGDLIDQQRRCVGDRISLRQCFDKERQGLSLQSLWGFHGGHNFLCWPETTNGIYSSKSGYRFIRSHLLSEEASSSSLAELMEKFKGSLVLSRCKEASWRSVLGFLPIKEQLFLRHLDINHVSLCAWMKGSQWITSSFVV